MRPFTIAYEPAKAQFLLERAKKVPVLLAVLGAIFLAGLVAQFYSALVTLRGSSGSPWGAGQTSTLALAVFIAALCGGMIGLFAVMAKVAGVRRTTAPELALRVDDHGMWLWPPTGGEMVAPWAAVEQITADDRGFKVALVSDAADRPGGVGLASADVQSHLRRMKQEANPGMAWHLMETVNRKEFARAVRHFSRGSVTLKDP